MAPILATATGYTSQTLDDPSLRDLLTSLCAFSRDNMEETLPKLVGLLTPWSKGSRFEEQIDLHDWIHPLNVMDAAFSYILHKYSKSILLVEPNKDPKRMRRRGYHTIPVATPSLEGVGCAVSLQDVQNAPPEITATVLPQLTVLLQFTAALLRHSTAKSIYQSMHYMVDLLAAADDSIADLALSTLHALALPPAVHRQQAPEQAVHTTVLHQMPLEHSRIVATARGWGTRAMGLGLANVVTADDSVHSALPAIAGELHFAYYEEAEPSSLPSGVNNDDKISTPMHVELVAADMMTAEDSNNMSVDDSSSGDETGSSKKRRKVSIEKRVKSTAELFFLALDKANGKIPKDRYFALLADIRLARSFHSRTLRVAAVERRLRALITMLHAHPTQEVIGSYFSAQPELCVEIVDLLRPTVSTANMALPTTMSPGTFHQDAIAGLVGTVSQNIPFSVRMLAVEALSALVLRRDGMTSLITGSGRLSSVLVEMGVGKGQYLGVLPTLIRYSLAALTTGVVATELKVDDGSDDNSQPMSDSLDVGVAFVEATMPGQSSRSEQLALALEFIDNVLTLTAAVVATPTGTSALVDCGLIPALLTTIAVGPDQIMQSLLGNETVDDTDLTRIRALLGYIASQAVQILEGAIVTHSNALSSFHELHGVDVLMKRLSREMNAAKKQKTDVEGDVEMVDADQVGRTAPVRSSQRVLLFGLLTCLTVVFHQENASSTTASTTSTGGAQLRKPDFADAVIEILDNVESYGGYLASLVATLLSDVLNSDPHVVHHVHSCGIGESFLRMLLGKKCIDATGTKTFEPIIPPVTELIMAIPNVISALSLTEAGAAAVKKANPFPSVLRILYHPSYAMPRSRCLLNEMTAILGTGLDEIMRHVEQLRPQILSAIAEAMNNVVAYAEDLARLEAEEQLSSADRSSQNEVLQDRRTCLMQYVMNFAQILEQILHNEEHCDPFVEAGGLDALLKMFPSSMPSGFRFLVHISGMSAPSVGTLHHSTLEESLSVAVRCLFMRYDTLKLIRKITEIANHYLDEFEQCERRLLEGKITSVVDLFPLEPFLENKNSAFLDHARLLSDYLRRASHVQWATNIMASAIRSASQRSQDSGTGWSRVEREWNKELSSETFRQLVDRLAKFHRLSTIASCGIRTEEGYESREKARLQKRSRTLRYKLRIVCAEGAVVRDGIEIDSCANVGSMEMGEIVEAFDRCINSSGILRYRTRRGWVSEMTRGHGREAISELVGVWDAGMGAEIEAGSVVSTNETDRRVEAGIPDLRAVAAGVFARGQAGYSELFASLSRLVTQGIRTIPVRTLAFEPGTQGGHVASLISMLADNIRSDLLEQDLGCDERPDRKEAALLNPAGKSLYLGCVFSHVYACLFEDKRERRSVNFPLLVNLIFSVPRELDAGDKSESLLFGAFRKVFQHGLADFEIRATNSCTTESVPLQQVSRCVAASFPPLIMLLRKILSTPLSTSPAASVMTRMKWNDVSQLLASNDIHRLPKGLASSADYFQPDNFTKDLQQKISEIVKVAWQDARMVRAPSFILYPIVSLIGDVIVCLEEATKKGSSSDSDATARNGRILLSDFLRIREREASEREIANEFEPSEEAIARLQEMGFSRDHAFDALENVGSNRLELAMDYALSHPPPSPASIERRRVQREERAQRRASTQGNEGSGQNREAEGQQFLPENNGTSQEEAAGNGTETEASAPPGSNDRESAPDEQSCQRTETLRAKETLDGWLGCIPEVVCSLLANGCGIVPGEENIEKADGDAEAEAATVVLSSFVLDISQRYPDRRTQILSLILEKLKCFLSRKDENGRAACTVPRASERGVANLCHALVLFTRALPKTRLLVLESDLASTLVSCMQSFLSSEEVLARFPLWMAPSLLLLDVMAQPLVAFSMKDDESPASEDGDLAIVRQEHKEQVSSLSHKANNLLSLISEDETSKSESRSNKTPATSTPDKLTKEAEVSIVSDIPAYFPLLPSKTASACVAICQRILSLQSSDDQSLFRPGLAHSTLLLLLRLLRSPKTSTNCLRMGVAEAILALRKHSRFTGNAGLVTLILRRLLEDEGTLQLAMEMEIRSTVAKLARKGPSSGIEEKAIPLKSFFEAVTPLLCREPETFLTAMACCLSVERQKENSFIVLASSKERARRVDKISKSSLFDDPCTGNSTLDARRSSFDRHKKRSSSSTNKSKTPHKASKRNAFSRKKKDKSDHLKSSHASSESPSQHIAGLLIASIISLSEDVPEKEKTEIEGFLRISDLLNILADIILAVPAFASAVHNYRSNRARKGTMIQCSHSLIGSPAPPKTFISFILHSLMPQDRWSIRTDQELWDRNKEESPLLKEKKSTAYRVAKTSQASARVLAALVARPGEGRKRVIGDLTFALSGGRLGHSLSNSAATDKVPTESSSRELCALQAWGEVCLGFAAPRSNGRNIDATSALSIETLRIMLEYGMVHALLYALKRVNLLHPMAANTCSLLLQPLEVLTRSNVTSAVKALVEKEAKSKEVQSQLQEPGDTSGDQDGALNGKVCQGENNLEYQILPNDVDDGMNESAGDADMGEEEHDQSDDEDISSSSEELSESDVSDESDMDDDDETDEMDEESGSSDGSDEVDDVAEWGVGYGDGDGYAEGENVEQYQYEDVDEEDTEQVDQAVDEGWTRIESSGFGGMLLGRRNLTLHGRPAGDPEGRARGVIDAAEAMIGSLLREADISSEALADIEQTLGIRIMSGTRAIRAAAPANGFSRNTRGGDSMVVRVLGGDNRGTRNGRSDVVGTLPHVHQRSRPDVGYSAYGRGGLWGAASPMEYVYGGPSITSGSRNYDVVFATERTDEDDSPSLTQLDLQLFPGGPVSAASARTQYALHPLLCGVDLPPMNSLVSDLLPHGVRAARRGQMQTRRPGDWTNMTLSSAGFLASTSNGNIIRSNRPYIGGSLFNVPSAQNVAGPVGWTDDGLPVDATVQEFSSAIERALTDRRRDEPRDEAGDTSPVQSSEHRSGERVPNSHDENERNSRDHEQESVRSDGERVATSLANGLRLSPRSEASDLGAEPNLSSSDGEAPETAPAQPLESRPCESNETQETDGARNGNESEPMDVSMPVDGDGASAPPNDRGMEEELHSVQAEESDHAPEGAGNENGSLAQPNDNGLVCPPDVDPEVFNSLPEEMQRDCVAQYNATQELAAQLDGSSLDPEVLAALPEDMRQEVIEQDRRERQRQQSEQEDPANPAHAEEMDNASFIASLAPDLREEILLTADEAFLNSLPPNIVAEAQILRERASAANRGFYSDSLARSTEQGNRENVGGSEERALQADSGGADASSRRRQRSGKLRVETDSLEVIYLPDSLCPPVSVADVKGFIRLLYLLSPVRPSRLLQKVLQNFCMNSDFRHTLSTALVSLLNEDKESARSAVEALGKNYSSEEDWRRKMDQFFEGHAEFPPSALLGAIPGSQDGDTLNHSMSASFLNRGVARFDTAASVAASLPKSSTGSQSSTVLPPVVGSRIIEVLVQLCKNSPRFSLHILVDGIQDGDNVTSVTAFESLIGLLGNPVYAKSSSNLEQLLSLLECAVSPLSHIPKHPDEELEISQRDTDAAAVVGKEWVSVPRVEISQHRLQLLCSTLRMETCRDSAFTKVNTIVRRLCRIESNRGYVLSELAAVAHGLGIDALADLRSLRIRLDSAMSQHKRKMIEEASGGEPVDESPHGAGAGAVSSSITLSTSTSEIKLLRVLQTLQALCNDSDDSSSKKNEGSVVVTEELVHLLRQMEFDTLWDELSSCLSMVQILEGVKTFEDQEGEANDDGESNDEDSGDERGKDAKKLRNSAAGLLTRFLPTVESFFVANASSTRPQTSREGDSQQTGSEEITLEDLVGGDRVIDFVSKNKVLLNALIRNNSGLLDKGLRALVQVPRCRVFLDFDVKRQFFKTQVRRLRQQASRRHGSLRLHIRRKYVFEDAYHQLRLRNADEMRGRLHITFTNEEGVDAGGLSREFFAILAKEIFNPNYALFTATEDGCTFQPNPNSSINPDHLSYFRFVGRIVGKAVADGFLLDAHFTRSLYKHMLGMKPSHHDMEAIDPDYYRNLQTILEYNLEDLGLDLTFSIEDHTFGRSQVIDLVPNGRKTPVTEENKEEYVRKVCQHRMTTAIESQIKAYLDGFYELVSPELISVFTPRELELLISGMPDIDVHDLKSNTDYVGWKATDKQIGWFWNILFSLSRNEKAAFLQFVTGSSKVPLAGFAELQGMRGTQRFSIHKASGTSGALMSAHTCFNSLDLPVYNSEEEMKEKLLYAINEGGGAFLFA